MTDEIAKLITVRFDERPADDVIGRLKAAGFRYRPCYYGLENVWTRRSSSQARLEIDWLEAFLVKHLCQKSNVI